MNAAEVDDVVDDVVDVVTESKMLRVVDDEFCCC